MLGDAMIRRYTAIITKEVSWYVVRCLELSVVSQGRSIEEAQMNLREAVELYLESFPLDEIPDGTAEVLLYPLEIITHD